MKAPLPANEQERLQALQRSGILNSAPEHSYDHLTELAASICGTPIAILSLIVGGECGVGGRPKPACQLPIRFQN